MIKYRTASTEEWDRLPLSILTFLYRVVTIDISLSGAAYTRGTNGLASYVIGSGFFSIG